MALTEGTDVFPVSGLRSPVSGLRRGMYTSIFEARPMSVSTHSSAMDVDWTETMSRVRALLLRRVSPDSAEDLAGEVFLALVEHVHAGRPVRAWLGLVASIVRTRLCRHRRSAGRVHYWANDQLDASFGHGEGTACCPATVPVIDPSHLRGRLQRAIASGVCAGKTCEDIAAEVRQPGKEVRRVLSQLCASLSAKNPACDSHLRALGCRSRSTRDEQ